MSKTPISAVRNSKVSCKNAAVDRHFNQVAAPVTRELNIYGKLAIFGVYTAICLFVGGLIFPMSGSVGLEQITELQNGQRVLIHKLSQFEGSSDHEITRLLQSNRSFVTDIEGKVLDAIHSKSVASSRIIDNQKSEITELKNQIDRLLETRDLRAPASVKQENILYSLENMSVLRYEQRQVRKRFVEKQKLLSEAYLQTVDLALAADQRKWRGFKDKQDLELHKLDQEFWRAQRMFRKNGYRVPASK